MDLEAPLKTLETVELVRRTEGTDLAYLFKHALVQDTAYASLLKNDRKRLHRLIGESLERVYPEALEENAALLAQHYSEAGDDAKTLEYALLAGDEDAHHYANAEAITHYSNALEAAKHLSEQGALPDVEILQHLYMQRGRAYELTSRHSEAQDNYFEMEQLAHARGAMGMELAGLVARSTLYATFTPLHDPKRARATAEQALALAQQQQDRAAQAKILWNLTLIAIYGESSEEQAVEYGEQALAIARDLNLQEQTAYILNDLFYPYLTTQNLERTEKIVLEAQEQWRALGNQPMLIDSLGNQVLLHLVRGQYQAALETGRTAVELAENTKNYWGQSYALMYQGPAHFALGDPDSALHALSECIRMGDLGHFNPPHVISQVDLGWVYTRLGALDEGVVAAERARAAAGSELPYFRAWAGAQLARCYLRAGKVENARELINGELSAEQLEHVFVVLNISVQRNFAIAEYLQSQRQYAHAQHVLEKQLANLIRTGARAFIPETQWLLAWLWLEENQLDQAEAALQQGRGVAQALGARWDLFQIYAALVQVAERRGDAHAREEWRGLLREQRDYIAARTPDGLRETFLNLPRVGQVANDVRNKLVQQK